MTARARRWGRLTGGVSKILLGSLVGQGILLGVSPILTRLYAPSDFAALTVFTGLATVLGALVTLSWERAVVIPRSPAQARGVMLLGGITVAVLGAVFAAALLALGPTLDRVFGTRIFVPFWWLLPVTVVVMGCYALMSAWLVRLRRFGRIAVRNAVLGIAQAAATVGLGLAGAGPVGLLSGMGVGRAFGALGAAPVRANRWAQGQSRRRILVLAKRYRRFPLVSTWSRMLNVLGLQLPPVLIVAIYGSLEAGLYALTVRVLAAPVGIVADAVSQYFEGAFAERVRARSSSLRSLIVAVSLRLLPIALVPAVVVLLFGPELFALVFGEAWRGAGEFARALVLLYVVQLLVSPVSRTLIVLEKQYQQLGWDVVRAGATAAAVVLPALFGERSSPR